jgi:predicted ester cyclase/heme-degrading monooxygenase HmoA
MIATMLIAGSSTAQQSNNINKNIKNKEITMSAAEKNKQVVQKLYEQGLNKKNFDLLKELISDEYVGFQGVKGSAGFLAPVMPLFSAIPDAHYELQDLVADDNKVAIHWQLHGTQTGAFRNIEPTGKSFINEGMAVFELKDAKITKGQVLTDRLAFLQSLEVLPSDLNQLYNRKPHNGQINFIDKFFIPAAANKEFHERMKANRNFIKTLPGFIEDAAYEYTDNDGNIICVTVARWESKEAMAKAKDAVQAEYKKEGFDMASFIQRLGVTIDRGVYTQLQD